MVSGPGPRGLHESMKGSGPKHVRKAEGECGVKGSGLAVAAKIGGLRVYG